MLSFLCIHANLCVSEIWMLIQHETILTIVTFINVPTWTPAPSLGLRWRSNIIFDRSIGMTQNSTTRFIVSCLTPVSAPSQLSSHESPSQGTSTEVHETEEARLTPRPSGGHWLPLWWRLRAHPHPSDMCKPVGNSTEPGLVSLPASPGTPKRTMQGGRVKGVWGLACAH